MMRTTASFGVLFAVCTAGVAISKLFPIPLPASVVSMLLLLSLLLIGAIKQGFMREAADAILTNMTLFFVPAGVSIIHYVDVLVEYGAALLVICVAAMVLTFVATLLSVRLTVLVMSKVTRR